MHKSTITEAIRDQKMLEISWKKETTGEYTSCLMAPYDIYPKRKKGSYQDRDILLGVEYEQGELEKHPATIYLDTMNNVNILNQNFDGREIKRIINPKNPPNVSRNW